MIEELVLSAKKIVFDSSVTFERRVEIRNQLQYEFSNFIFTLNTENDLIITNLHHASRKHNNQLRQN